MMMVIILVRAGDAVDGENDDDDENAENDGGDDDENDENNDDDEDDENDENVVCSPGCSLELCKGILQSTCTCSVPSS